MFRQSMFVILGLMAAVTLGCEKKQETPAAPSTSEIDEHAADAHSAVEEMKEDAKEGGEGAMNDAAEKVEEAAEKVEEAAGEVKDAAEDVKLPGQ